MSTDRLRMLHKYHCKPKCDGTCPLMDAFIAAAAIGAELEREECAALALGEPDNWGVYEPHGEWIASAIRARGSK